MLKTIVFAGFLATASLASVPLFAQTNPPAAREGVHAEHEVVALAGTYANAIVERDVATLERLLAEDFIDVSPDGTVSPRAQFIAEYANPSATAPKFESAVFDASDAQVRVYGDTALMTGRSTWRGSAGGQAFTGVLVSTMVAVHRDGQWEIAASHSSSVPPVRGASSPAE
ncbi:nuclear transport factor 2 family protein [Luteimonas fraxinea]|uniref:Nuclear transport factor 2 family protein n=1 Tax=Luteimonas fraxinea TaxID=2901869 RepID=A0ABS8UHW6_9GAMM|nr:nuclear transport factor 2 family protein [Luteimonas fraxinea]MCD9098253.1 nuclear transport factor 2 family protein [Luteimonas fraxinea]MCD9126985.1 nuclear transport factor 2 family protein [Luteimonas fraxinea]UHH08809.1 nuclear transport factor 2 family protein [Luteimonas fraxinea]